VTDLFPRLNRLKQATNPKGLTTAYTYNALGDLLIQASPDTGTTRYTYDPASAARPWMAAPLYWTTPTPTTATA
jgi:YD repeat-containing protein